MVKQVDTPDLKSVAFVRPGSSPGAGTILWSHRRLLFGGFWGSRSHQLFIRDTKKLIPLIMTIIKIRTELLPLQLRHHMEKRMPGFSYIGEGEMQRVLARRISTTKIGKTDNRKMALPVPDIDFWYFDSYSPVVSVEKERDSA